MKAVLLAAGKGSRITSEVDYIPKPLIEVNGKSVIQYNIEMLKQYGIEDIIINTHYKAGLVKEALGDGGRLGVKIRYYNEDNLLGTAGTIKSLKSSLNETFLVIYGDNITSTNIHHLLNEHYSKKCLITIAVYDFFKTSNSGIAAGKIVINAEKNIEKFVETKSPPTLSMRYVNAGIYVIEPEMLNCIPDKIPCDFSKDVFPELLERRKTIHTYVLSGFCYGIDTLLNLKVTKELLDRQG